MQEEDLRVLLETFLGWTLPEVEDHVFATAYFLCAWRRADAEDLTNDVFSRVIASAKRNPNKRVRYPKAYLSRATRNIFRSQRRGKQWAFRWREEPVGLGVGALVSSDDDVAEQAIRNIQIQNLNIVLARLDADQRILVEMVYQEGMTITEAAKALGRPRTTVMSQLQVAQNEIRKLLNRTNGGGLRD